MPHAEPALKDAQRGLSQRQVVQLASQASGQRQLQRSVVVFPRSSIDGRSLGSQQVDDFAYVGAFAKQD